MTYFPKELLAKLSGQLTVDQTFQLVERRNRLQLPGFENNNSWGLRFDAGDVILLSYERGAVTYTFQGVCLTVSSRGFGKKQTTFSLRSVISGVGVEITMAYFLHRLYKLSFNDYKRKYFLYVRRRLYFIRARLNQESKLYED